MWKAASKGLLQVKIHQRERTGPAFHLHRRNGCHRTKLTGYLPKPRLQTREEVFLEETEKNHVVHGGSDTLSKEAAPGRPAVNGLTGVVPDAGRTSGTAAEKAEREEYLLVDGYNIILAWPELKDIAKDNMDSARTRLLDLLGKYRGMRKCHVIAVFDAYRVQRKSEDVLDYGGVHVVLQGKRRQRTSISRSSPTTTGRNTTLLSRRQTTCSR